ncbi:MAG TPA: mechanosensitive ion channel family protein [Acidimicrobiales bacterium]|nr:mechanosensitive ion channel family protein [Acidimicrobiales bacterium]
MRSLVAAASNDAIVSRSLTARDWIVAGVIVVVGGVLGAVVRRVVERAAGHPEDDDAAAEAVGRFVGAVLMTVAMVYALGVIGLRLGPLVGALGIGGLAIAFASQSILANVLSSLILQLRRPFRRGDQVAVCGGEGILEHVNFRTVVLRTYDGERVMVPCAQVLSNPITNHTAHGRRRTTLAVDVSYAADLEKALEAVGDAVRTTEGVLARPAPQVHVQEFGESGVTMAVRYWHAPDSDTLWRVRTDVALAVKRALGEAGIEIPFPQRVLRFATDGEPGWRTEVGATAAPEA